METLQSEAEILASLSADVERHFAEIDDLAHGWEHVQRVYTTALYLAEQEGANRFIVGVAALMHDLPAVVERCRRVADAAMVSLRALLQLVTVDQASVDLGEAVAAKEGLEVKPEHQLI